MLCSTLWSLNGYHLLHTKSHMCIIIYFVVFVGLRFELKALHFILPKQVHYCLSHISSPFCSGYFTDEVFQTVCSGCSWTSIFQISQEARITGMSHQSPSTCVFLIMIQNYHWKYVLSIKIIHIPLIANGTMHECVKKKDICVTWKCQSILGGL
jgi:hypothetical protein